MKASVQNLSWLEISNLKNMVWPIIYVSNQTRNNPNVKYSYSLFLQEVLFGLQLSLSVLLRTSKYFQELYKVLIDYNYKRKNRMTSQGTGVLGVCRRQPCSASLLLLAKRFFVFFFLFVKSTKRNKNKS